jgi:hypothetical protein
MSALHDVLERSAARGDASRVLRRTTPIGDNRHVGIDHAPRRGHFTASFAMRLA